MSSTYLSVHYHIVISTKNRTPSIADSWQTRLHEYLGGTVNGLDGISQGVGGVADHVHLLVGLKATHKLSDFMRELKKALSVWVHEEIGDKTFGWQNGCAAFAVGATSRASVKRYIAKQAEHHRVKTFREELIELLHRAGIDFDGQNLD